MHFLNEIKWIYPALLDVVKPYWQKTPQRVRTWRVTFFNKAQSYFLKIINIKIALIFNDKCLKMDLADFEGLFVTHTSFNYPCT